MNTKKAPSVTLIGGGTGSFALLSVLKDYVQDITALVNMVDDGGSTGRLRDELGVLPPGDIRQCLVALSRSSQTMRDLFNYRFSEGSFEGHSFGNIFLTAVEKMTDHFSDAVKLASEVLDIQGTVVPITLENVKLVLEDEAGNRTEGEDAIGESNIGTASPNLKLEPSAAINPEAKDAILRSDMVVIAPGDLYTSLIPNLLVNGVVEALQNTDAKIVYVCNLMNDEKHTQGYTVDSFVKELERFMGADQIDYVLYNNSKPNDELLQRYALADEVPVAFDQAEAERSSYIAKGGDLIASQMAKQDEADKIERTFIRHDGDAVARQLMKIFYS